MKLRFIGEDGSMGLKNGEAYDARIYIRGKFLWVEWKVGRFMTRSCPYSSTKAFAQNWDLAYTTENTGGQYGTKANQDGSA